MATHRGPCARYRKAKEEKFRARSAYKLMDVDDEFHLLANAARVVDLCAAPGSWCQVLRRRCPAGAAVVAVDLQPMAPLDGVVVLRGDITTPETAAAVVAAAGGPADVVVCDGAPEVTGVHDVDEFAHASLMAAAAALAARLLRPGGAFVAKLFRCTDAALAFVVARDFRGGRTAAGFLEKGDLGFAATAAEPPGLAVAAAWT
ncbi:tRNA methyltransferase [Aureococcus anophagefferens]|nr:tRNA methyltransferase [Aureococcus anophagefferens]